MGDEDRVDIRDAATGDVVEHCYGPSAEGACPYVDSDRIVPCSGHRVTGEGAGPEYWNILVPPHSQHCPQAWNLEAIGY